MKKIFLSMAVLFSLTVAARQGTQTTKGSLETRDMGSFKLHVYNNNDAKVQHGSRPIILKQ